MFATHVGGIGTTTIGIITIDPRMVEKGQTKRIMRAVKIDGYVPNVPNLLNSIKEILESHHIISDYEAQLS